jgi:hypothetical protein
VTRLVVFTADELIALDVEGRGNARRAAREAPLPRRILQAFFDRGGPIPVEDIVVGLQRGSDEAVHDALIRLDDDDLIRIRDGYVDLAYPFSASPTAFVVRLPDGRERYACCATDALGIAPMVGQAVGIRSRCHHCGTPLELSATPEGPGPEARGVMLWVGKRTEDDAGPPTRSERPSTSSGRKNTSASGEMRIRRSKARELLSRRASSSVATSSGACSSWEDDDDESFDHGLLVLDLTVLSRGERVSFVSRHRLHGQERRRRCSRP